MEHQTLVDKLLYPCWRAVGNEYKRRYSLTIWSQFESAIKASAYTDRLADFIERLTRRLQLDLRREDLLGCSNVLTCGDDRTVLSMLRGDTALLTIMVRLKNEERKADE